ncbi:MFS transporter [Streptomyces sp. NPDC002143]
MTPTSASPSLTAAPSKETGRWNARLVAILVALIWPTQMLAAVGIIGANAIPGVAQSFHTTQVAWFGLIGNLVTLSLTPFVIALGDRYGKRRLMLTLIGLGVIGDVIAALASSFPLLLLGRGIAACYGPFAVLSFPAVRDLFPARLVKSATAFLGSSVGLVALAAPFLAGWLVDTWGYKGALWFIAASTAVAFVLVAFLVPETPRHDFRSGVDWLGGLLLGAGLTSVVYSVGQGQSWGWTSGATMGWLAAGVVALAAFVLVERSSAHPILDLKVVSRRPVALAVTAGALAQSTAFTLPAMGILLATYPAIPGVSDGLGWSAWHNAEVGVSWNLVMLATGFAAGRALRRVDALLIWKTGLALAAAGYGLMGFFHADATELVLTACLANLGTGLVVATAPVLVLGVVSADEQGQGSGMFQLLAGVFGTVFTAVCFAALAAHDTVVHGTAFYLDAGFSLVFWTGTAVLLLALVISLFVPVLRDPEATDTAPALAS